MKTKIIKIISFIVIFYLFASNSLICKNGILKYEIKQEQEKSDSVLDSIQVVVDPVYDFIIFELYEYYKSYYKYPANMDTFVNYLYNKILNIMTNYMDMNIEEIKQELDYFKTKEINIINRKELFYMARVFNYCYVHRNEMQFIYEDNFIALICGADSIYFTYKKPDACIDRYGNDYSLGFRFIPPSERIKFYNITGKIVFINSELIHTLYKSIHEIINEKYRKIWIDDNRPVITAILKYNKQDGLSSFCPDDNIDLENDSFFIEVENILYNFTSENKDIYEIIIPLKCCESKKIDNENKPSK
jgi:hypothetical protein